MDFQVPLHKEPGWLWDTIDRWLQSAEKHLKGSIPEIAAIMQDVDFRKEAIWLRETLEKENCPVVFCHNDMQEGNILISLEETENNNGEPRIVLIGEKNRIEKKTSEKTRIKTNEKRIETIDTNKNK